MDSVYREDAAVSFPITGYHGIPPPFAIPLAIMPQQLEVRAPEDDWTGINNSAERRKLQNRLNSRLFRRRHGAKRSGVGAPSTRPAAVETHLLPSKVRASDVSKVAPTIIASLGPDDTKAVEYQSFDSNSIANNFANGPARRQIASSRLGTLCGLTLDQALGIIRRYENQASEAYRMGSPKVDHLLTLIQFNVSRALISNTTRLGFPMDWLTSDDCISPFNNTISSYTRDPYASCPESLRPTELQRTVVHHPWFDLFPFPAMRDNILRKGEDFDDGPLCLELVEFCDVPHERTGLVVWGEPWDPSGWEVSEPFLKNRRWVLEGCWELLQSTNHWRALRGEEPLSFDIE